MEPQMPAIGSVLGVLAGTGGHEPGDGFGDQPVQLRGTDLARERRHLGIHVRGRFR